MSKCYYVQLQHHTCRISGHFTISQTSRRCNNDLNWKCHMSLQLAQYEYKLL